VTVVTTGLEIGEFAPIMRLVAAFRQRGLSMWRISPNRPSEPLSDWPGQRGGSPISQRRSSSGVATRPRRSFPRSGSGSVCRDPPGPSINPMSVSRILARVFHIFQRQTSDVVAARRASSWRVALRASPWAQARIEQSERGGEAQTTARAARVSRYIRESAASAQRQTHSRAAPWCKSATAS
jgi:hypothetical protein